MKALLLLAVCFLAGCATHVAPSEWDEDEIDLPDIGDAGYVEARL